MEIHRKELKRQARQAMALPRPPFWAVILAYLALTLGVNYLLALVPLPGGDAPGFHSTLFFLTIFYLLYKLVVEFGLKLWALWTWRRLNPGLGALLQGFSVAGRVILLELLLFARMFLWVFALSILAGFLLYFLPTLPLLVGWLLLLWIILLRYALAPYLLADRPDDGPGAAIGRSTQLMRGWCWQLAKLELSFLGWVILAYLLTVGVQALFLWQAGGFEMLFSLAPGQIADLPANYLFWSNGLQLMPLSQGEIDLFTLYYTTCGGFWCSLCCDLIQIPLLLWLLPYQQVARAGFYQARLQLQQDSAPPLPPL